jgi:hypothetical protein
MSESERIRLVRDHYHEAYSAWRPYFEQCDLDYRFYLGDQWDSVDLEKLLKKNIPALTLNYTKKHVDTMSGHERQNRTAVKVYPIEGGDEGAAEIYSQLLRWMTKDRMTEMAVSGAFKDALIGGLGMLTTCIDYNYDILNGDVVIKQESPFSFFIDPGMTQADLSDCSYIIRHSRVHKNQLKILYPNIAEKIKGIEGGVDGEKIMKYATIPDDRGERLLVKELWRKEWNLRTCVVNTLNPNNAEIWQGEEEELGAYIMMHPEYISVKKKVPEIKLTTVIEDDILAYDGANPYETTDYPFHPIFGFFESSYKDWDVKLSGIVRPMRDPQREKNKRRSQIMHILNTTAASGIIADRGAVDDITSVNSGGAGKYYEVNPGKRFDFIKPPTFPDSVMQLEMAFSEDLKMIGVNPDLIGIRHSDDPGISIQLRQKSGMMSHQELFDHLSIAKSRLGKQLIEIINLKFDNNKIQRILGQSIQLPQNFDEIRKGVRFDAVVDETIDSPTHRLATLQALLQYQQYGGQVDPQTIIELADIPKSTKDGMLQRMQAQQAAAQQGVSQRPPQGGVQ